MADPLSFGAWARRRRRALDLTQQALAQQISCAVITLQKIESDERRPSRAMAERMADALAIPTAERAAFVQAARSLGAALTADPAESHLTTRADLLPPPRADLPTPPNVLIGRERVIAALLGVLRDQAARLVTLTGPGGVGKTRLALEVATSLATELPNGVWFVPLAPISDPTLVATAIAQALGLREHADQPLEVMIQRYLRSVRGLLLLDNFEHVITAAPLVAGLLAAAPGLRVLATSRIPLRLSGEQEYIVPPLGLPDPAESSVERLLDAAAAQLFLARARAARSSFTISDVDAASIAQICRRLDGLPLAIELAAARVKLFRPAALLARLDQQLDLLTGGARDLPTHQQTLRTTIDWSHTLLDAAQQALFARLAIMLGGCSLEAAEAICGQSDDPSFVVLDGIAALLDQSLLRRDDGHDDEPRVMMLETIRAYALERLDARGELDVLRHRHAAYFLAQAEAAEPAVHSPTWPAWQARLEREYDNLRAALIWCAAEGGDALIGLRLASALRIFWGTSGHAREGQRLTLAVSGRTAAAELPPMIRARALLTAAVLTEVHTQFDSAQQLFTQSIALFRAAGDTSGLAAALVAFGGTIAAGTYMVSNSLPIDDPLATARMLLNEGLTLAHATNDRSSQATALHGLAHLAIAEQDVAAARDYTAEALQINRTLGDDDGIAHSLWLVAINALNRADLAQAHDYYVEHLAHVRRSGLRDWEATSLGNLGWVALLRGDVAEVERCFGESGPLAERLGDHWQHLWSLHHLGWVAWATGDLALAEARHQVGLTLARSHETQGGVAWSLNGLGLVALSQGDPARAEALFRESLAIFSGGHVVFDMAHSLNCLGRTALSAGAVERAEGWLNESLVIARPANNRWTIAHSLELLAGVASAQGRLVLAAQLLGTAEAMREQMPAALWPPFQQAHESLVTQLRAALGAADFVTARQAGRAEAEADDNV